MADFGQGRNLDVEFWWDGVPPEARHPYQPQGRVIRLSFPDKLDVKPAPISYEAAWDRYVFLRKDPLVKLGFLDSLRYLIGNLYLRAVGRYEIYPKHARPVPYKLQELLFNWARFGNDMRDQARIIKLWRLF